MRTVSLVIALSTELIPINKKRETAVTKSVVTWFRIEDWLSCCYYSCSLAI